MFVRLESDSITQLVTTLGEAGRPMADGLCNILEHVWLSKLMSTRFM